MSNLIKKRDNRPIQGLIDKIILYRRGRRPRRPVSFGNYLPILYCTPILIGTFFLFEAFRLFASEKIYAVGGKVGHVLRRLPYIEIARVVFVRLKRYCEFFFRPRQRNVENSFFFRLVAARNRPVGRKFIFSYAR